MRATIDKAGRLVIPKQLRDDIGLSPGEVEVSVHGTGLRVEPVAGTERVEKRGRRVVITTSGLQIDDEIVRAMRDAGQK